MGQIQSTPAVMHTTAWHRSGDKPLPESMRVYFDVVYMRHLGSMNQMRHLTLMLFNTTLYMTYWIQDLLNNIT